MSFVFALLMLFGGCKPGGAGTGAAQDGGGPPQMPPPAVSVAAVVERNVTQWDEFTGRVGAVESVEVRPRVAGNIESVNFKEGAEVKKGDVLFIIDQRSFKAQLAKAQADLARAHAEAQLAEAQAARARALLQTHTMSQSDVDEKNAARSQAEADIRAGEATLQMAQLNLDYTEIRAPIDGRVGRALVTAGNLVSGGEMVPQATLLTTIVSLDPVYVYFDGDEQTYLRYGAMARSGERPSSRTTPNPVWVGLANEDGFPHQGHMDFVDNQLDPATGTIRVRAVLDNKDRMFTPGLFARVRLLGSGEFKAMLIDDRAVLTDQDRRYVYVLGPNNIALRKDVKLGRMVEGLRVVNEGLATGDKVIVHGVQKVFFPGMPVAPQEIKMGDPPPPPPAPGATAGAASDKADGAKPAEGDKTSAPKAAEGDKGPNA
jgi:multidrug efflux system membrane fusion protein